MNNYKIGVFLICTGILTFSLLFFFAPAVMIDGIRKGLSLCGTSVIPSLFPFTVISDFILRSGLGNIIGRRLAPLTDKLFRLSGAAGCAVLLALVSGFPVGARLTAQLYGNGEITQKQGRRMLFFCVNAGPAFVVGTVGAAMLGSRKAGVILFISLTLSSLLIGFFSRFADKNAKEIPPSPVHFNPSVLPESVNSSVNAMLSVCACILLFSGLNAYLIRLPVSPSVGNVLSMLSEVTGGCLKSAGTFPAFVCAFVIGWSGFAVHCQLLPYLNILKMKYSVFLLSRLLSGTVAAVIAFVLFKAFPCEISVFSSASAVTVKPYSVSVPASAAMLLLAAIMIIDMSSCTKRKNVI